MQDLLKRIEEKHLKAKEPQFDVGDTVKVKVLIREGKKERVQAFEGLVISIKGGGINKTFTVRRIFQNIGIERTFMVHSPKVQEVKVIRQGKTRRAKLYYLRKLIGNKATRLKEDSKRRLSNIADEAPEAEVEVEETAATEEVTA